MRNRIISLLWRVAIQPLDRSFGVTFLHRFGDGCESYYVIGERLHRSIVRTVVCGADRLRVRLERGAESTLDDFDPEGEV